MQAKLDAGVYTLHDLRTICRKSDKHWCPYFLARHMMAFANVIVYNYQYMLDPKVRLKPWMWFMYLHPPVISIMLILSETHIHGWCSLSVRLPGSHLGYYVEMPFYILCIRLPPLRCSSFHSIALFHGRSSQ